MSKIKVTVEIDGHEVLYFLTEDGNERILSNSAKSSEQFNNALHSIVDTSHWISKQKIDKDFDRWKDGDAFIF